MILKKTKIATVAYEWSDSYGGGHNYPQPLLAKLWELKHPNVGKGTAPSKEQLRGAVVQFLDAEFSTQILNEHIAEIFLSMQRNRCFRRYIEAKSGQKIGRWGELYLDQVRVFVDYVAKPEKLREAQCAMKNLLAIVGFSWDTIAPDWDKANLAKNVFGMEFERGERDLEIPFVLPEIVDIIVDEVYKIYTQNDYFVRDGCGWNLDGLGSYAFDRSDPMFIEALTLLPDQEWYDVYTVWGPWNIVFADASSDQDYVESVSCIVHEYEDQGDLSYTNVFAFHEWPDAEEVRRWIHPGEPAKKTSTSIPATGSRSMDKIVWDWMRSRLKGIHLHETNYWTINWPYRYKIPFGFRDLNDGHSVLGGGTLDFVTEEYAALYNAMLSSDRNEPRDLDEEIKRINFDA